MKLDSFPNSSLEHMPFMYVADAWAWVVDSACYFIQYLL